MENTEHVSVIFLFLNNSKYSNLLLASKSSRGCKLRRTSFENGSIEFLYIRNKISKKIQCIPINREEHMYFHNKTSYSDCRH